VEIALAVVAAVIIVVAVSALADRWRTSAPLVLVVVGVVISFLPFVPTYTMEPEIVLIGILPPLLYSAAYNTSFIDFRANKGTIASLSVGLVIFTTLVVGFVAHLLLPGLPLAAGFALGAVVAPPDAVAATAIARRVGMPHTIVQILEGESLVNDATALTALRVAIAALAGAVTVAQVGVDFLLAAGGGVVVGLVVAYFTAMVRSRIRNPAYDTALSFTVPYLAYLPAEQVHASGIIAVVVAGLVIGHRAPLLQSGTARLTTEGNWRTLAFLLENGVFLLIGLQLRQILTSVSNDSGAAGALVLICVGVYLTTVVTRLVWVFGTGAMARISWFAEPATRTPWSQLAVVGWAGMRGVVTLAAALILPMATPQRNVLILVAFFVVVASLLIQGTTLRWLVRRLRLPPPDAAQSALQEAALLDHVAQAGFDRLDELVADRDPPDVISRLRARSDDRRNAAWERISGSELETPVQIYARLRLQMLSAERARVLTARDEGGYDDDVIRRVIRSLDVEQAMLETPVAELDELDRELTAPASIAGQCAHLLAARPLPVPVEHVCPTCVEVGSSWVHLRMCLTCGTVGCCDSSPLRHATAHFHATEHPVIRSIEPNEAWRWCYIDQLVA
jgi:monovalent cation/hydrogen antiporter